MNTEVVVFIDCLNIPACAKIFKLYWRGLLPRPGIVQIKILDSPSDHGWSLILRRIMWGLGFRIEEAIFFAGHLRRSDGEAIYTAASEAAKDIAFKASERILLRSKFLDQLNRKWGRNTVLKHIAVSLQMQAMKIIMQLMVAEALSERDSDHRALLFVRRHIVFDPNLLCPFAPAIKVVFYKSIFTATLRHARASAAILLLFYKLREIKWVLESFLKRESNIQDDLKTSVPSLLLLQEDDLSLDRSCRTQPHWLFPEDGKPPFQTIVLKTSSVPMLSIDKEALKSQWVIPISTKELYLFTRQFRSFHPIQRILLEDIWKCLMISFTGSSIEIAPLYDIAGLLYNAKVLASFCKHYQVRVFMTCENYIRHADSMILIGPYLNITTLSYQYSSMSKAGPIMMTTADHMFTFSSLYHHRWIHNGIGPVRFTDIGYLYDTSFKYVRSRAYEHKQALKKAGAQFIICYFDESVQTDKYGLTSESDHYSEIMMLMRLVLDDSSVGLIVKTQFQWNSPQKYAELTWTRTAASATGRYIELSYGIHRNIIFPAEAALFADMSIGHAIGTTAPLESALSGARCILLNPYGVKSNNDVLYAKCDIVYPSITDALLAIGRFRSGNTDSASLGDWSPIIDQFDPFRDGQSSHRLRNLLEKTVQGENT